MISLSIWVIIRVIYLEPFLLVKGNGKKKIRLLPFLYKERDFAKALIISKKESSS